MSVTQFRPMSTTVADVMHGTMPLVSAGMRMTDTIEQMTAGRLGCVGVVDSDGCLMGIITDGDLRRNMDDGMFGRCAADIMTWRPITAPPSMSLSDALKLMNERKITVLFVVNDHRPIGVVHMHDLVAHA